MDKKIGIVISVMTALIFVGGILLASSLPSKTTLEKTTGAKIQASETSFDFKDVSYSGGNVSHEYPIQNVGDKDLVIANLTTSCMCTNVFLKTSQWESPKFGMAGHTTESGWKGILKPGETGAMVVVFDPTAHGPQGVGPVERMVSFETNDPDKPYLEFSFAGKVVKK